MDRLKNRLDQVNDPELRQFIAEFLEMKAERERHIAALREIDEHMATQLALICQRLSQTENQLFEQILRDQRYRFRPRHRNICASTQLPRFFVG